MGSRVVRFEALLAHRKAISAWRNVDELVEARLIRRRLARVRIPGVDQCDGRVRDYGARLVCEIS